MLQASNPWKLAKQLYIFDSGSPHMTPEQGKDQKSGTSKNRDTKIKTSDEPASESDMWASMKRIYKKYMGPQGKDGHYTLIHDVVVAGVIVIIILTLIFGYTRKWPPVVVVESGSMQHSSDTSALGVIDTGDIVMVQKVDSTSDITTWAEGQQKDYKTYGEYGDVIIYDKNGKGGTPVIHRAIVFIRHNETVGNKHYFDVPEWNIRHNETISYYVEELQFKINFTPQRGYDGYLTKGDNRASNPSLDQQSTIDDAEGNPIQQVSIKWVKGVARGEIPWFGLIKLKINDNEHLDTAPDNSWTNLKVSMFLLLGVPIILNVIYYAFAMKYGDLDDDEDEKDGKDDKDGKGGTWKLGWKGDFVN